MSKQSKLQGLSIDDLKNLVKNSKFLSDVLRSVGLTCKGTSNFKTLRQLLEKNRIDYSHCHRNRVNQRQKNIEQSAKPLEQVLTAGSNYNRNQLKKRLIREGLLPNKCSVCGLGPYWNSKTLTLQIDHINGDAADNRLHNLRLLCPNCHSQTDNFAGRYIKNPGRNAPRFSRRKVKDRPDINVLKLQVEQLGYRATGRLYGVSDNAIRKWIKQSRFES